MTKKLMLFFTASLLSAGILTGCGGNTRQALNQTGSNVSAPADTRTPVTDSTDDLSDDPAAVSDSSADNPANSSAANNTAETTYISKEEATQIALSQVEGASADELRIHKDTEDGRNIYEVSLLHDGIEYDLEIDAISGDVLKKEKDSEDDLHQNQDSNTKKTSNSTSSSGNLISEKKAGKIALKRVEGASEKDLRIHKDVDDGKDIYEGSIVYNEREYEFEIDAASGDVLEWDSESIYD